MTATCLKAIKLLSLIRYLQTITDSEGHRTMKRRCQKGAGEGVGEGRKCVQIHPLEAGIGADGLPHSPTAKCVANVKNSVVVVKLLRGRLLLWKQRAWVRGCKTLPGSGLGVVSALSPTPEVEQPQHLRAPTHSTSLHLPSPSCSPPFTDFSLRRLNLNEPAHQHSAIIATPISVSSRSHSLPARLPDLDR